MDTFFFFDYWRHVCLIAVPELRFVVGPSHNDRSGHLGEWLPKLLLEWPNTNRWLVSRWDQNTNTRTLYFHDESGLRVATDPRQRMSGAQALTLAAAMDPGVISFVFVRSAEYTDDEDVLVLARPGTEMVLSHEEHRHEWDDHLFIELPAFRMLHISIPEALLKLASLGM